MKIWYNFAGKVAKDDNGKVHRCDKCPCLCEPKVIAAKTVNGNSGPKCWDLSPYQGVGIGYPNAYWRLIETGACLHYGSGRIDAEGRLLGLRNEFCSSYSYNGYMELQQGCEDENGVVRWPGRCG